MTNPSFVSLSDPGKILAVFKQMMKNNKNIKKLASRASRTAEAQRQLLLARDLVSARSAFLEGGGSEFCHSVIVCVDLEWWEADQSR